MWRKIMPSPGAEPLALSAIAVLLLAFLAAYVAGYFALCRRTTTDENYRCRLYGPKWQATMYWPAGKIESLLIGKPVEIIWTPPDICQRLPPA